MRQLCTSDLSFAADRSTAVISDAQKFVLPVPDFGVSGEPLVVPDGQERAGQPILDYRGRPLHGHGVVFFNAKDRAWQGAAGDGTAVIIVNDVSVAQARQLDEMVRDEALGPMVLSLRQLKEILDRVRTTFGLPDMYNSTRAYVDQHMRRIGRIGHAIPSYGLFRRDDHEVARAVYIAGPFSFCGPAGSPQQFANGGVVVHHAGEARGLQPDVFTRTYRLADGRSIGALADDIASQ